MRLQSARLKSDAAVISSGASSSRTPVKSMAACRYLPSSNLIDPRRKWTVDLNSLCGKKFRNCS